MDDVRLRGGVNSAAGEVPQRSAATGARVALGSTRHGLSRCDAARRDQRRLSRTVSPRSPVVSRGAHAFRDVQGRPHEQTRPAGDTVSSMARRNSDSCQPFAISSCSKMAWRNIASVALATVVCSSGRSGWRTETV